MEEIQMLISETLPSPENLPVGFQYPDHLVSLFYKDIGKFPMSKRPEVIIHFTATVIENKIGTGKKMVVKKDWKIEVPGV